MANIIEESKLGGPQIRLSKVATALEGKVCTTVLLPNENSDEFRKMLDNCGIPYRLFWMSRITKQWNVALRYVLFFPYEVIRLALHLRKGGYDLVHISGGAWQYKGVLAAKLSGITTVWHLNDTSMPRPIRYIFQLLSPMVSGFICSSYRTFEYYGRYIGNKQKTIVIHPPVDVDYYVDDADSEEFNRTREGVTIGTVCNINPIKNIGLIIRAAHRLNMDIGNSVPITVEIVGPVNDNQRKYYLSLLAMLENLEVRNVHFLGGQNDVRPFLKRVDVYVCSSLSESGPMSLFEAMVMKKAVVSTDVGDVSKFINNGENGYVIDLNDDIQLAECLSKLIRDQGLRAKLGSQAQITATSYFSLSRSAVMHEQFYKDVVFNA